MISAQDLPGALEECAALVAAQGGRWILKSSTGNAGEDLLVFDAAEDTLDPHPNAHSDAKS